jgi:hypothetical protein
MDIYLAGTQVTLVVPLQDRNGNPLTVTSISYRVVDNTDTQIVPLTALATFIAASTSATIVVPATLNNLAVIPATITNNQIDMFSTREVRTVELHLTISGNTVILTKSYALESDDPLMVGLNSFQTLPQAELVSIDIPNLLAWSAATDSDKLAALIDARSHICMLNFWLLNSNINWGQDSLNFIPDGTYQSPYISTGSGMFIFNGNLSLLTPTQYNTLPIRFRAALCKAQVAESDSIMGGDPIDIRRREGLMLESIGEVKQMFRAGKPIDLPVSKRALKYLSQFVTFAKHTGRG